MRKLLVTTLLVLIVHSNAFGDDPPGIQRDVLPPAVGTIISSAAVQTPAHAGHAVQSGTTTINACKLETMTADGALTVTLTAQPRIEHSSKTNGAFSVAADRMRFSIPSDTIRGTGLSTLSDFEATGTCVFSSDSIRVSANRMVLKSLPDNACSTIKFEGDVSFWVGKISGSANSITLTRTDAAWNLSGLLAAPKEGR